MRTNPTFAVDSSGRSPYDIAVDLGNTETAHMLIQITQSESVKLAENLNGNTVSRSHKSGSGKECYTYRSVGTSMLDDAPSASQTTLRQYVSSRIIGLFLAGTFLLFLVMLYKKISLETHVLLVSLLAGLLAIFGVFAEKEQLLHGTLPRSESEKTGNDPTELEKESVCLPALTLSSEDMRQIQKEIKWFASRQSPMKLVFGKLLGEQLVYSTIFRREDRGRIHAFARSLQLRSRSRRDKAGNRCILVSSPTLCPIQSPPSSRRERANSVPEPNILDIGSGASREMAEFIDGYLGSLDKLGVLAVVKEAKQSVRRLFRRQRKRDSPSRSNGL